MLTIHLYSFSYKMSGIPADTSGNGGGFVFDCRFITNPGRKDEYKTKTGLDDDVKKFLESQENMQKFLEDVHDITDRAIQNYLDRGFTNLFISFGCTGGQHRSVYAAERTREHIQKHFPDVNIELHHDQIEKGLNTN
ncbi:MAG: RNase adapter RapZ [Ignavibacteria bacterium]|jgi:RNase adaptor protein for sRNA GlmZ degradation